MKSTAGSWIVFIVLGGILGALRYGGFLSPQHVALFARFGPWMIGAIYIALILQAFKDSVYLGILSLLVPLYPFYYLFLVSDAFYARAVVGGLLVGIGVDSALFFQGHMTAIIDAVQRWIASGG